MSSADVLLNIATAARLFHASDGTGFADLIIDGHRKTWPLRSKRFGAWLRQQYERTRDASFLSSGVVACMSTNGKGTEAAAARVPGQVQRLAVFGPPLLLEGEDATAYDELLGRICAAVRSADVIDEMFIADVASLEWEVLRWRRLKRTLMQEAGFKALENFLAGELEYDLYSEHVADRCSEASCHSSG